MLAGLISLSLICVALLGVLVWLTGNHSEEGKEREKMFTAEREAWVRERRDLNTRIQMPQAAPFLLEEEGPSNDDMPVMPEFVVDEAELERARLELEEAGYSEGPVA
jgi:hypothetical protein